MGFTDTIRDYLESNLFSPENDPAVQILIYGLIAVFFIIIGLGGFAAIRYLISLGERPAGRYLTLYKFAGVVNENGERTSILGHLAVDNDALTPNMLNKLKRITDIKQEFPEVAKLAKSGKVFFYNFKLKESEKSGIFKENKRSIIISPIDLDDKDNYWEDQRGEFSVTANGLRLFPRTVDCFKTSEYKEIPDPHGHMVDVYRLSVIPQSLKKAQKALSDDEFALEVAEFPNDINAEILGTMQLYLPTLIQHWERIEPAEKEKERLRKENNRLLSEMDEIYRKFEPTKLRAIRKSMVGHPEAQTTKQLGIAWGWRFAYFIAGLGGYAVIPNISFLAWITAWGGAFVGLITIFLINAIIETKNKPLSERPSEANESET